MICSAKVKEMSMSGLSWRRIQIWLLFNVDLTLLSWYNYSIKEIKEHYMEKLFVYSYLWQMDLDDGQKYSSYLDTLFINTENNTSFEDLLLDLETLTDSESSFMRIKKYVEYETSQFDAFEFGKQLFYELEIIYCSDKVSLELFGQKCYELFNLLPSSIDTLNEPFYKLCYIDDMIQFNSENETREIIVEMLDYFKP
jgi:hypothetical protein